MVDVAGAPRRGGPDGSEPLPEVALPPQPPPRVGPGFITLYAAAYMGTSLMLVAPLLVEVVAAFR